MAFNLALQQFGVKNGAEGKTAVAVVGQSGGAAKEAHVNLYGDGKLLQTENAMLAPGGTATLTFREVPEAEVYRAEVEEADDYAADNEAYAFSERNETARILLLTRGNLFLEKALQLTGAEVVKMTLPGKEGEESVPGGAGRAAVPGNPPDLVVIDEWRRLYGSGRLEKADGPYSRCGPWAGRKQDRRGRSPAEA